MSKNNDQGNEPGHISNHSRPESTPTTSTTSSTPLTPEHPQVSETSSQVTAAKEASQTPSSKPSSEAEAAKAAAKTPAGKSNEFVEDMREMVKTKDMTKVNEKYVKPAYEVSKKAAIQGWNFIEENTPKVIAAGKDAWAKTSDMIQKMKEKQAAKKAQSGSDLDKSDKSDKNPPPPPAPPAP